MIECLAGFRMSVMASHKHKCKPRKDWSKGVKYNKLEVNLINRREPIMESYCDDWRALLNGTYDKACTNGIRCIYVPAWKVYETIKKHGGMISGKLPRLDIVSTYQPLKWEKHVVSI